MAAGRAQLGDWRLELTLGAVAVVAITTGCAIAVAVALAEAAIVV